MLTTLSLGRLGRFGNQCFTISGIIGIATRSGQSYGFPQWVNWDHKERFGSTEDVDIYKYLENELPPVDASLHFRETGYFWGYRDINLSTGNWSIDAHLQSEKYFRHCMPIIRHTFRFKNEPEQNEFIAIHYRAGDYQEGENVHHPRCNKEYYASAIVGHTPANSHCIIFSDNAAEAKEKIGGMIEAAGMTYELCTGNYLESFTLMKRCKSFICANSTFSLFAALLGEHPEKRIIAPKRWFGNAWPDPVGMAADIYPEGCIIL